MVLSLKTWESRSSPGLPRAVSRTLRFRLRPRFAQCPMRFRGSYASSASSSLKTALWVEPSPVLTSVRAFRSPFIENARVTPRSPLSRVGFNAYEIRTAARLSVRRFLSYRRFPLRCLNGSHDVAKTSMRRTLPLRGAAHRGLRAARADGRLSLPRVSAYERERVLVDGDGAGRCIPRR